MAETDSSIAHSDRESASAVAPDPTVTDLDYRNEVWRKLLHLFALTIPIGYYIVSNRVAVIVCFTAFLLALLIDLSRIRNWSIQRFWIRWTAPIVRPRERAGFTGATNILASAWLCPLLFSLPAAVMGMATIILGDTAAALVGRRWGRHRIRNGRTVEGSLAFLVAATLGGIAVPNLPLSIALPGALIGTVVEAVTRRVDDNLSVPIMVALFADIALQVV
ncbi:MAG: phosphatidate cytidylyltransferase [candidate division Zixibacteria bacterium]|nr:phosphatidate cytidylyltransferase [candidate division Zixibacteria bacterium]